MKQNLLLSLFALMIITLSVHACKSDPKDATGADEKGMVDPATRGQMDAEVPDDVANQEQAPGQLAITDEMRSNGLTKLLDGKWNNLGDPTEVLEVKTPQIIYYKNGKQVKSTTYELDFTCSNSPCKDIKDRQPGWCMVEDGICKTVTRLDMLYFIVQPADGSAGKTQYKKVKVSN